MRREMHHQLGGVTLPADPDAQMAAQTLEAIVPDLGGLRARTERPRGGGGAPAAGRPIVVPLSLRARTR